MGQKTNPISLRLDIHRDFDNAWYSDKSRGSYSKLSTRELQIRKYLESLFDSLDLFGSRVIFQIYPKKLVVHSFFMDWKNSQSKKFRSVDELKKKIQAFPQNLLIPERKYSSDSQNISFLLSKYAFHNLNNPLIHAFAHLSKNSSGEGVNLQKSNTLIVDKFQNIRALTNFQKDEILQIYPVKISSKYSSAEFVAQSIAKSLSRNISFREIFRTIQKELPSTSLRGLRISCSGRLGGAEMAKVESRKFGQTSLHTFSANVDYAVAEAYTLYGIIGVKVWLVSR